MDEKEIILNNIFNRKSVRKYTDEEIYKEDLITILKAGMSAPSTCNFQPWQFIVIQNKKTLEDMANIHKYAKMFKNAKAGIIVLGNMEKTLKDFEEYWVEDCSAATENILLSIEALGLGAVWTGIYPVNERINKLKDYFDLPENIVPFALLSIGYPKGPQSVKNKWDETKIHWEKW
jgi:nitroreductase